MRPLRNAPALGYATAMGRYRTAWTVKGSRGRTVRWTEISGGKVIKRQRLFPNAATAKEFIRLHNAKVLLRGTDFAPPVTLNEASNEFIDGLAARSIETRRQYMQSIHRLAGVVGDCVVSEITPGQLDHFVEVVLSEASESTAAKHIRQLQRFFRWCVQRKYMTDDPTENLTARPRQGLARKRPHVTDEDLARLLKHIDTDDRKLAVLLAATTGLDRGIIARLSPADIDLEARQIKVVRQKTRREVHPFIHDVLLPELRRRIRCCDPSKPVLHGVERGSARRKDWFREAAKSARLPDLWFRDLRSVAANWMRSALGDFGVTKALGHSSPKVTEKHYHVADPKSQQLVSKLPLPGSPRRRRARSKRSA
jgi:integrase